MFTKIKIPTAPEVAALKIKQEILEGNLGKGAKLPPERDLAQMLGVGRSTVREAMQILRALGLITVKGGKTGGSFVRETNVSSLTNMFEILLELEVTHWREIFEVRRAVEPFANKLAAENRTAEDLDSILHVLNHFKDHNNHERYASFNTAFHVKLAKASHNKLLMSLTDAITNFINRSGSELFTLVRTPEDALQIYDEHYQIYLAVKEQKGELALKLTEQHILFSEEKYREMQRFSPAKQPV